MVAAAISAVISTSLVTSYVLLVRHTNPNATHRARDMLELFDSRINQELASREYRRAALMPLDGLD